MFQFIQSHSKPVSRFYVYANYTQSWQPAPRAPAGVSLMNLNGRSARIPARCVSHGVQAFPPIYSDL